MQNIRVETAVGQHGATPSQGPSAIDDKISAYYCLLFPNFTYYLQTLTVSIGRRPAASSSDMKDLVDIDLGPLSQVSRLHARIEYDDEQENFVLAIHGRNGAWVDGVWYASGRRVPLGARTQIMIATQTFHFILPTVAESDDSQSLPSSPSMTRAPSPSVDILSLSPATVARSMSLDSEVEIELDDEPRRLSKPKVEKKRKKPLKGRTIPKLHPPKPPPPEKMPPKPQITYANLAYRAIKAQEGRATLQEVCKWISDNFEWYRLNEEANWQSSVRHTLSSNKGFVKVSRKSADNGKGFWWTVSPEHEATFESHLPGTANGRVHPDTKLADIPKDIDQKLDPTTPVPSKPAAATPSLATKLPSKMTPTSNQTNVQQIRDATIAHVPAATAPEAPQAPGSVIIPIVIKELSPDHPAVVSSAASSGPASVLLAVPPIVHDRENCTLVLNPAVFSSLASEELQRIQNLGFSKALEELSPYIVKFVKKKLTTSGKPGKKTSKIKNKEKLGSKPSRDSSATPIVLSGTSAATRPLSPSSPEGPPLKKRKTEDSVLSEGIVKVEVI